MPRISYFTEKKTESKVIEWPVTPRVGEYIVGFDSQEYKVTKVVHAFERVDTSLSQIQLDVEVSKD